MRAAVLADLGNAVGASLPIEQYTFINADLTVSLHREPVGEWLALDAVSRFGPAGAGVASCVLHDQVGPVGHSLQHLVARPR